MATILRVIVSASACWFGPAMAANTCAELCDAGFYASATAESVQQLIESGVDVNAKDEVSKSAL
ncbi:hypothetical protein [Tropicimonas sp. IMCC6043]|uniref:hypothetical protein n=1 Tax=Tropicimonas sp. IMCC6043 TaxID=2510645 RepID=UPI00101D5F4F|nr:hypothetical protein [Tropicimonas sp. IMCC6043]RYH10011.1 hypothetical protein EU800_10720 [Tropicimonas sp. IMCC6043]